MKSYFTKLSAFGLMAALSAVLSVDSVYAQFDADGHVLDDQVLVLGPFNNGCGCSDNACIDQNFIAPSSICEAFAELDEPIDYNSDEAASTGYQGPTDGDGNPIWREFSDGAIDGNIDFNADGANTGGNDDVMSMAGFYIEVLNDPQLFNFCVGSDDGNQIFVDGTRIWSNNACRGSGFCQDRIDGIELDVGTHFIVMAVFERGGGFNGRISLRDGNDDSPITIDHPNVQLLGQDPGGYEPPICNFVNRDLFSPSNPNACPPEVGGPATGTLSYELLDGEAGTDEIIITEIVNGVAPDDVDAPGASKTGLFDGWIGRWLLLGPLDQGTDGTGHAPGEELIRADYLTDGDINDIEIEPVPDEIIEIDFNGTAQSVGLTPGYDVKLNPDGLPTWYAHDDADPNVGINFNTADFYNADLNQNMVYAVTYVDVPDGGLTNVWGGIGSDDSAQVLVNGEEKFIVNVGRGWGGAGQVQNAFLIGDLEAGINKIMIKVFEGGGGHGFRFRLQDENGNGIGVPVCFDPDANDCVEAAPNGTILTYETTKGDLGGDGVTYTLNVDDATISTSGETNVGPVIGDGSVVVLPEEGAGLTGIDIDGDGSVDFENAHTIGPRCPDLAAMTPEEIFNVDQDAGTIQISGSGADIWTNGDTFSFAYNTVEGDFSARVTYAATDYAPGSRWGKNGIMARQDCSQRSRYSFTHENGEDPQDATTAAGRRTHGGNDNFELRLPIAGMHVNTLRLDREGNTFISYVLDEDGSLSGVPCSWFELHRETWADPVPAEVQVGLAVTSHTTNCTFNRPTFTDWQLVTGGDQVDVPENCAAPVQDFACTLESDGSVSLTWNNDPNATGEDIAISVNGEEVASVAGNETSYSVSADALIDGNNTICATTNAGTGATVCCGIFTGTELYINAGGPELNEDLGTGIGDGRIWLEDTLANPSPFLVSENLRNANFDLTQFNGEDRADTQLTEPDFVDGPAGELFSTERWLDGPVEYVFPVPPGDWQVQLLFLEACCSDQCEDIPDPFFSIGGCRVFDIFIDDNPEGFDPFIDEPAFDQFSQVVEIMRAEPVIDNPTDTNTDFYGKAFVTAPVVVEDTDTVRVLIQDLGAGNPPENASIKGIALKCLTCDVVSEGPRFRRGDTDGNGALEITDPINNLAFQFLGTFIPPCMDAADYDDNGKVEITDPIANLSHQFLGTAPPAPPGKDTCGEDPTDDDPNLPDADLGCETEPAC